MALPTYELQTLPNGMRIETLNADFLYDQGVQKTGKRIFFAYENGAPRLVLKNISSRKIGESLQETIAASETVRKGTSFVPVRGFVVGEERGIVLDYAPGKPLRSVYVEGELTNMVATAVTKQLAQNVRHLHAHDYLLGDFNLANMFWHNGRLHLIDHDSVAPVLEHNNPQFHSYAACIKSFWSSQHAKLHTPNASNVRFGVDTDKESFARAMLDVNEENTALPAFARRILEHWSQGTQLHSYSLDDFLEVLQ